MIGIKIADGSFYPILEEGKPGEKRIEVTTVSRAIMRFCFISSFDWYISRI